MGWATTLAAATLVAACSPFGGGAFTCDQDQQCGPNGRCEAGNHLCSFPDATCASGFRYGEASGSLSGVCVGDEPPDAELADGPPVIDGPPPLFDASCIVDGFDLCVETPQPGITFGTETVDTSGDPRCVNRNQPGGGQQVCLIYATSITVTGGATVSVTGNRPLALAASGTVQIDGTIDAGSTGGRTGPAADDGGCGGFGSNPENDTGGAAGGAGGSFAGAGGNGGEGDNDNSLGGDGTAIGGATNGSVGLPAFVRGGCRGQDGGDEGGGGGSGQGGARGSSGGAVWVLALGSVNVAGGGAIGVTGQGGGGGETQSGGGGAGSGGMIRIAAPAITIGGTLAANGGGGGGGGARITSGGTNNITGGPGGNGGIGPSGGAGGIGAQCCPPGSGTEFGGRGGVGADGVQGAGPGGPSGQGAAGGGGSVGFIVLVGPATVTGTVSPTATQL